VQLSFIVIFSMVHLAFPCIDDDMINGGTIVCYADNNLVECGCMSSLPILGEA
jgi:hypothetical protein